MLNTLFSGDFPRSKVLTAMLIVVFLGLLLTPGDEWQLELTTGTVQLTQTQWPHALNLLRTLLTEQGACQHAWKNRVWNWQRKP